MTSFASSLNSLEMHCIFTSYCGHLMCISVQYSDKVTYMYFDFFLNVEAFELGSEIKSL